MSLTFKSGVMQDKLRVMLRNAPDRIGNALYQEALIEMKESMARTPVDTGALRASHVVVGPNFKGKSVECAIQVGGSSIDYAWYVHENLEAHHEVGQAKFLESTLLESRPYMADRVARRLKLMD